MVVNFDLGQLKKIKELSVGSKVEEVNLIKNRLEYKMSDGRLIRSGLLDKSFSEWFRLQKGYEEKTVETVYRILIEILEKL